MEFLESKGKNLASGVCVMKIIIVVHKEHYKSNNFFYHKFSLYLYVDYLDDNEFIISRNL